MTQSVVSRVRYFPGQFLRRDDFDAEQTYHLQMRRRHNTEAHTWGIVCGLDIRRKDDGLFIQSGMAIDGFGRELILVEERNFISLLEAKLGRQFIERRTGKHTREVQATDGMRFDLLLQYRQEKNEPLVGGYGRVDEGIEPFCRWKETVDVLIEDGDRGTVDWRDPAKASPGSEKFAPTDEFPDDLVRPWRVFLGQLITDADQPHGFRIDPSGRPYAGIVADSVRDPGGRGWLEFADGDGKNPSRFAVLLTPPKTDDQKPNGLRKPVARLTVAADGTTSVFGETKVHGDLTVAGPIRFEGGPTAPVVEQKAPTEKEEEASTEKEAKASPEKEVPAWNIGYHRDQQASESSEGSTELESTADHARSEAETPKQLQAVTHQLRIEMEPVAGELAPEVVIGSRSDKEKNFKPALTVRGDDTVIVHGNLIVEGLLKEQVGSQLRAGRGRTPARMSPAVEAMKAGIQAGTAKIDPVLVQALSQLPAEADLANMREQATIFGQKAIDILSKKLPAPAVKATLRVLRYLAFIGLFLGGWFAGSADMDGLLNLIKGFLPGK